ncbi:unannotated protein [freshwater metagenome]|uniref:Unannotated protein n=1 Tax=freshwater metagenome TaxID=449393 RepID=A0A6J7IWI2_9ZZZZ
MGCFAVSTPMTAAMDSGGSAMLSQRAPSRVCFSQSRPEAGEPVTSGVVGAVTSAASREPPPLLRRVETFATANQPKPKVRAALVTRPIMRWSCGSPPMTAVAARLVALVSADSALARP